jgi:cell division protein FtsI/penicillin-binding protein 2
MLDEEKFIKRAKITACCLAGWAVLCICMFFYYAVIAKNKYINLGNKLARRELVYYPQRSRIVDKNDVPLAWSEKYYDLYFNNLTGSPGRIKSIFAKVKEKLPKAEEPCYYGFQSLMYRGLTPEQILSLKKLVDLFQELQITPRLKRITIDNSEVKKLIGRVKAIDGRLQGYSGLEKQYNDVLSGEPGKYRIMIDRNKKWIEGSGKSIKMAVPGKDVRLPFTLEEIRQGKIYETGRD